MKDNYEGKGLCSKLKYGALAVGTAAVGFLGGSVDAQEADPMASIRKYNTEKQEKTEAEKIKDYNKGETKQNAAPAKTAPVEKIAEGASEENKLPETESKGLDYLTRFLAKYQRRHNQTQTAGIYIDDDRYGRGQITYTDELTGEERKFGAIILQGKVEAGGFVLKPQAGGYFGDHEGWRAGFGMDHKKSGMGGEVGYDSKKTKSRSYSLEKERYNINDPVIGVMSVEAQTESELNSLIKTEEFWVQVRKAFKGTNVKEVWVMWDNIRVKAELDGTVTSRVNVRNQYVNTTATARADLEQTVKTEANIISAGVKAQHGKIGHTHNLVYIHTDANGKETNKFIYSPVITYRFDTKGNGIKNLIGNPRFYLGDNDNSGAGFDLMAVFVQDRIVIMPYAGVDWIQNQDVWKKIGARVMFIDKAKAEDIAKLNVAYQTNVRNIKEFGQGEDERELKLQQAKRDFDNDVKNTIGATTHTEAGVEFIHQNGENFGGKADVMHFFTKNWGVGAKGKFRKIGGRDEKVIGPQVEYLSDKRNWGVKGFVGAAQRPNFEDDEDDDEWGVDLEVEGVIKWNKQ